MQHWFIIPKCFPFPTQEISRDHRKVVQGLPTAALLKVFKLLVTFFDNPAILVQKLHFSVCDFFRTLFRLTRTHLCTNTCSSDPAFHRVHGFLHADAVYHESSGRLCQWGLIYSPHCYKCVKASNPALPVFVFWGQEAVWTMRSKRVTPFLS